MVKNGEIVSKVKVQEFDPDKDTITIAARLKALVWRPAAGNSARLHVWRVAGACLLPAFLALFVVLVLRLRNASEVLQELDQISASINQQREEHTPENSIASEVAKRLPPSISANSDRSSEQSKYLDLLSIIVYRTNEAYRTKQSLSFHDSCVWLLASHLGIIMSLMALIVVIFPSLFVSAAVEARRRILRTGVLPVLSGESSESGVPIFSSFEHEIEYARDVTFLHDESRGYFWKRFAFSLLIAIGLAYVMAPRGLRYATMFAVLGGESPITEPVFQQWMDQYKDITPSLAGFMGFFIYSLTVFLQRYQSGSLTNRMLIPLVNRGVIVIVLSLLLSSVAGREIPVTATAFMIGIFPQTGIEWISKLAKTNAETLILDRSSGFQAIPEIDLYRATTLGEVGIADVQDLAAHPLERIIRLVGIEPRVLVAAVDRAVLTCACGPQHSTTRQTNSSDWYTQLFDGLKRLSIHGASGFVRYMKNEEYVKNLAANVQRVAGNEQELLMPVVSGTREDRIRKLQDIGLPDPNLVLQKFQQDANVIYILKKCVCYCGVPRPEPLLERAMNNNTMGKQTVQVAVDGDRSTEEGQPTEPMEQGAAPQSGSPIGPGES
jgi:hypothetical protein